MPETIANETMKIFGPELGELREERFRLRVRIGTMQLENPKMVKHIRRDVARLNTILRERELSQTSGASRVRAGAC